MKKIIVSFITVGLLGWQLPSQSQEQQVEMHVLFDLNSEHQSQIAYHDPPNREILTSINSDYMDLQHIPSDLLLDHNSTLVNHQGPTRSLEFISISNEQVVPRGSSKSIMVKRFLPSNSSEIGLPKDWKYQNIDLPKWIKPAEALWPSNRMQLPQLFGIRLQF